MKTTTETRHPLLRRWIHRGSRGVFWWAPDAPRMAAFGKTSTSVAPRAHDSRRRHDTSRARTLGRVVTEPDRARCTGTGVGSAIDVVIHFPKPKLHFRKARTSWSILINPQFLSCGSIFLSAFSKITSWPFDCQRAFPRPRLSGDAIPARSLRGRDRDCTAARLRRSKPPHRARVREKTVRRGVEHLHPRARG